MRGARLFQEQIHLLRKNRYVMMIASSEESIYALVKELSQVISDLTNDSSVAENQMNIERNASATIDKEYSKVSDFMVG